MGEGGCIVLTMIGISNSNKTCDQNGCQSRTNAYIQLQMECYIGINIGWHCLMLLFIALLNMGLVRLSQRCSVCCVYIGVLDVCG